MCDSIYEGTFQGVGMFKDKELQIRVLMTCVVILAGLLIGAASIIVSVT